MLNNFLPKQPQEVFYKKYCSPGTLLKKKSKTGVLM